MTVDYRVERVVQQMERHVDSSSGPDACWPWIGSRNEHGYGQLRVGGQFGPLVKAHRMAWMLANDNHALTPQDHICHHCDNPPCCNPAHLYRGTVRSNMADMMRRGRAASTEERRITSTRAAQRGDNHWTRRMPDRMRQGSQAHNEHGTTRRYTQGCRCEQCRAANATYKRELRRRG